jgi:AraC-like DNA-binding protein
MTNNLARWQQPVGVRMFIVFDRDRPSESPFIERVWSCHSERAGPFSSVASPHCEMVFTRLRGRISVTVRGPETRARQVECPADGEWLAIRFRAGTFIRSLPALQLIDGTDAQLPQASRNSFWLQGERWEYPGFENAEAFVAKLARADVIAHDSAVAAALNGDAQALSQRSIQRRFLSVCGVSFTALRQIERARRAARLLTNGLPIVDVLHETGFYDQAHLTRSMQRYVGATPAAVLRGEQQLSFLYKK